MTLPSVKNFQLQIEGAPDPNQVSLQFGKTGDNTFTVRPPSGRRPPPCRIPRESVKYWRDV